MELISWEGHTLNKIVDRCVLLATSFMEGAGEFPYPYQIEPMKRIFRSVLTNDGANITALFARQMGKCLGEGTKVIMYDGSLKKVEDVKVGDVLMGDDSTPRTVLSTTFGYDKLYKVTPKSDNAKEYVVNSSHILSLKHKQRGKITKVDIPIEDAIRNFSKEIENSQLLGYQVRVKFPGRMGVSIPTPQDYGISITEHGFGKYYGFALDGNHRLLLEDFTVTHNSSFTAATISTLLIIAPLLSRQFPDKFPYFKKGIMIGVFAPTAEQVSTTHARVEMMLSHDTSNAILNDPDIRGKKKYDSGLIQILGNPHKVNGVVESDWKSFVRFQTAAKQAKIESKSYQITFVDECLTGDSMIDILRKGETKRVRLDKVKVGDYALAYDENNKILVYDKVVNKWHRGKRPIMKITTLLGAVIKCTSEHKIFTDTGWTLAENLHVGDCLQPKDLSKITGIASIESNCSIENVYDIETEHTHNFFANGLLVHNCQEVDDTKLNRSIRPMLAAYNGTSVYTGTPSPYICEFYNAIMQNRASDISKPDYLRNHYEYDATVGGRYNIRYKKFVEGEKEKLGEDSDYFQASYMLRWLTEKGMALSPSDFQKYMSDGRADIEYSPINGFTYVAGLDLGKGISDPSVLTIARLEKNGTSDETIKKVVHWKEYSDRSWETQFEEILITLRSFNISSLAVDATGKGDPIVDRLKATLAHESISIYGIVFSTQSKHTMATDFYEEMFKHRIRIPSGKRTKNTKEFKKFYGEWLTAVKTFTGKYLQLEHPRDKANSHDDYVDSLLLMIYAAKKTTACVVKREFVDWRTPSTNKSQTYASATEYARVRVNELFNKGT